MNVQRNILDWNCTWKFIFSINIIWAYKNNSTPMSDFLGLSMRYWVMKAEGDREQNFPSWKTMFGTVFLKEYFITINKYTSKRKFILHWQVCGIIFSFLKKKKIQSITVYVYKRLRKTWRDFKSSYSWF